jgi:Ca-activated chloride channel family protein
MTDERNLIEELREVDRLLPGLALEEPPEALVEQVLDRVRRETPVVERLPERTPARWKRPALWAVPAMFAVGAFAAIWTVGGNGPLSALSPVGLFETADSKIDSVVSLETAAPEPGDAMADASDSEGPSLDLGIDLADIQRDVFRQEGDELGHNVWKSDPELTAEATPTAEAEPPAGPALVLRPPHLEPRRRNEPKERSSDPYTDANLRSPGYVTLEEATPEPTPEATPSPGSESYAHTIDQVWTRVADDPLSTFSIDVDTASYANIRRFLTDGSLPPMNAVRIEEMLNYFSYQYPAPRLDAAVPFTVTTEVGPAPWAPEHKLVHVGLQAADLPPDAIPPRNLVFLLDVSGSMNSHDKLPLLKRGLSMMVPQLRAEDRVAIVVYAGAAGVVLAPTPGNEQSTILGALDRLSAGGSTHGSAGIQKAYELARRSFNPDGVNRVILATDGDFNVGTTSDGALIDLIERERESGVFLTVLGFGRGNLKDAKMEALADHGNGNYAYIDSVAEAHKVLVAEAGATLVTVAKDVKIQVEFNPATVEGYRLIGYANRRLAHRDFTDDTKDAGEVGAGHSVTALYEIIPVGGVLPDDIHLRYQRDKEPSKASTGTDELMFVSIRYKKPDGRRSTERSWAVHDRDVRLSRTSDDFRFSAAIAGWGMLLRGSRYVGEWTLQDPADLAGSALSYDPGGYRNQAMELMDKASDLATVRSPPTAGGYRPR